jgi:mono/diheme cytochrome c family protein
MKIVIPLLALVMTIAAAPALAQGPGPVAEGKQVFTSQGCYGCHTVEKYGTPIGPDLSLVGRKHSETWIAQWLRDPASQKPTAHMPRLQLSEAEVRTLTAYLSSLR